MIVGCYALDLYCAHGRMSVGATIQVSTCKARDNYGPKYGPWSFTGKTEAEAKRSARKAGWKFRNGDAVCPYCAKF